MRLRAKMSLTPPLRDDMVGEGVPGNGGELIVNHYMQTDRALQIDASPTIYRTPLPIAHCRPLRETTMALAACREKRYLSGMMNDTKPDWDQAWQGMEPEQPRPRRAIYVMALAAAIFLLLGACTIGYFILQQRTTSEPGLILPGEETATPTGMETTTAATDISSGNPSIAPTVTLPAEFAAPPQASTALDAVALRATTPIIIDGNAAEWVGLPVFSSPHIVFTGDSWDGSDDLAASWQMAWDDTALYLMVNVADDIHAQNQLGNQTFRGDSIELQIDADRAGDFGPSLSPDDFQIALSPGDFNNVPPSAFRFQGTSGGSMLDAPGPHSIMVAATPSETGYLLEAAIPWRDLNISPSAGLVIGLAVNVNDNDRPGTAVQELMKSSAPDRRFGDPTSWGTLTLE